MVKSDRSKYMGEYIEGNRHGYGIHIIPKTGDAYIGQYSDDCSEGLGIFKFGSLGESYAGDWTQGLFNGTGVYKYSDGGRYVGQFEMDKKHGLGVVVKQDSLTLVKMERD